MLRDVRKHGADQKPEAVGHFVSECGCPSRTAPRSASASGSGPLASHAGPSRLTTAEFISDLVDGRLPAALILGSTIKFWAYTPIATSLGLLRGVRKDCMGGLDLLECRLRVQLV